MLISNLRQLCQSGGKVHLRLPLRKNPKGNPHLCGRHGPVGVTICVRPGGNYELVAFDAAAVLKFLDRTERSDDANTTAAS